MKATAKQLQCIHTTLHKKGLLAHKGEMVSSFTNNRTESSKEMTSAEASEMLKMLFEYKSEPDEKDKMIRSIIAMAREMRVVFREQVVEGSEIKIKTNYKEFDKWMEEKSYLKKPLKQYSYKELPTLVSQYKAIYNSWLKK